MPYADQLLCGIADALELEAWEVAEALAKVLARHIRDTGEHPTALPRADLEALLRKRMSTTALGPS